MYVEIRNEDGIAVDTIALDADGVAVLVPGSRSLPESFFERKLFVPEEWAKANGAGDLLPSADGVVLVPPESGEAYLRALVAATQTGYENAVLVSVD